MNLTKGFVCLFFFLTAGCQFRSICALFTETVREYRGGLYIDCGIPEARSCGRSISPLRAACGEGKNAHTHRHTAGAMKHKLYRVSHFSIKIRKLR